MKHTPGPWRSITTKLETSNYRFHSIMSVDNKIIAHITDGDDENLANADLMAAAPELLEACEYALKRLKEFQEATGYPTAHPQIELEEAILEEVIKKAKGEV